MINEVIKKLSYAVFPRRCDLCGDVVALNEERCDDCRNQKRIKSEVCTICGCEKDNCICGKNSKKPEYKQIVAPYYYEKSVAKAIHRFKFYGYKELSSAMAEEIAKAVKSRYNDIVFDYITYVPMTEKKMKKRGYNQSQLLAEYLSAELEIPVISVLKKVIETPSQRGSSANKRKINLYGAFDICDDIDIDGKTVLLIDDVKTTGSTLNECSVVLKSAGATVYCATFAITLKN